MEGGEVAPGVTMLASKGPWRRGEGQWETGQQRRTLRTCCQCLVLAARTSHCVCWKPRDQAEAEG